MLIKEDKMKCSFCKKTKDQVKKLIAGPDDGLYICDHCIAVCSHAVGHSDDIVAEPGAKEEVKEFLTPEEIAIKLDEYVVGQNSAKEVLSVAIYNHHKRINNPIVDGTEIQKSNILFVGPSGSGKTLLASSIAHLLELPFAIADSTALTEAGYIGADVDSIFQRLLLDANGDVETAQHGIVFIDEIDKKSSSNSSSGSRDVSGEGVQQSLLRLVEGTVLSIQMPSKSKSAPPAMIDFDTKNILFIVGGAFVGIDKIIQKRQNKGPSIGVGAIVEKDKYDSTILTQVEPKDFQEFGLIREFVGRFPIMVAFHDVDEDMLIQIMNEPKNCIVDQYKGLFKLDGVELEFDDQFIHNVATQTMTRKTGARGLRSIFEKYLTSIQFTLPTKSKEGVRKIKIDKTGNPTYTYRPGRRTKVK